MGVFDFFGTIGSGWLSDRVDNRALLFIYYGLRGLSLLYLPGSSFSYHEPDPVRGVLRPRLDRDRAADRAADGRRPSGPSAPASPSAGFSPRIRSAPRSRPMAAGCRAPISASTRPAFYVAGAACIVAALSVWLIGQAPAPSARAALCSPPWHERACTDAATIPARRCAPSPPASPSSPAARARGGRAASPPRWLRCRCRRRR